MYRRQSKQISYEGRQGASGRRANSRKQYATIPNSIIQYATIQQVAEYGR